MWSDHRSLKDTISGYSKALVLHMRFIVLWGAYLHRSLGDLDACFLLAHRTAILIDTILLRFDRSHVPRAIAIRLNCLLWHVFLSTFFQRRNQDLFIAFEVFLLN